MEFDKMLEYKPYELDKDEKMKFLGERLIELTRKHRRQCPEYRQILDSIEFDENEADSYESLPFLPVRMFKERNLKSVSEEEIFKTMTSSGTTGQAVSKIFLDRTTSANQQKTMVKIVSDFTGSSRMPMIIIDCPSVIKNREMFSARGAGILGFSIFGSKKIYALDDDMKLDIDGLRTFLKIHKEQKILLFGFTFIIWHHFYKELKKLKNETGEIFDFSNAILIHGGGWKKMISEAVSEEEFRNRLTDICGLSDVHDYYGMVEQTGCIYMQCECGHFHSSVFSDVIIRNPKDFSICPHGEKGIIQVVSSIPESYPGHSLLTEDEGVVLGEDDCPCGRKGKYFKVVGRLKEAEIRGCSDTYAADHSQKSEQKEKPSNQEIEKKVTFLVGNSNVLFGMPHVPVKCAFDKVVLGFLNELSKELMSSVLAKSFPDVVSFAYWLRKASLKKLKDRFGQQGNGIHIGRGVVFHVTPSNVPVNYAYSLVTGLLCGNANIVRIPSKEFPQIAIINHAIINVLEKYPQMKHYICLIRYSRDTVVNDFLSKMCDARVVWGGDATVAEIRKSEIPARAVEIAFADRYSLAVIDADVYMKEQNKKRIASDFYNDTYLTDQNACTSPRVVVWLGDKREEAKQLFWEKLYELVEVKYHFQPIMAVDKLTRGFLAATGIKEIGSVKMVANKDNLLVRVKVSNLMKELMDYRGNSGYFYEYDCNDIMEIHDFCNDPHCQTIGIVGNKEIIRPLLLSGIKGVDRVVCVGQTMDFDLAWDGYNLVESLTRTVVI